ncbi:MAG: SPFH domain-containing protein [Clostridiales bacterium]|nr:SPFH domain-containing protein [Clostridiales bacterium]
MNFLKRAWLKSRWIGTPPLKAGEMLRQSSQIKQGLVMGMRLAVLEDQAAAVLAQGRLVSVFLPGAYQLEQEKMPPLTPDAKYDWLYPAKLYFLNLAPTPAEPWQPKEPLLTRDPERGLVQLLLSAEYEAQIENATLFMQSVVLTRGFYDWPAVHIFVRERLNEMVISLLAHNQTAVSRLGNMNEKLALALQQQINRELRGSGLTLPGMRILTLEVHPQMRRLWQEQKDHLAFNRAVSRSITG